MDEVKEVLPVTANGEVSKFSKFNVYFTTFWHLTHLASANSGDSDINATWQVTNSAGRNWRYGLTWEQYSNLNGKVFTKLKFLQNKFNNWSFAKRSLAIVAAYDQCLGLVNTLADQMEIESTNVLGVCAEMTNLCESAIESFKKLPLLWSHLFVSRIQQLLLLAKDCYQDTPTLVAFDQLFEQHANFTTEIRKHFSINSISTADSDVAKLLQPVVPLDALIFKLGENATCTAEQIPTALTAIIHEYSYFDPFCSNDDEFIKTKAAKIYKIDAAK